MEAKISIAEILKDKPEGTKLWTDMFGEVTLYVVTDVCDAFQVKHHNKEPWFDKDGKLYKEGALCIYPSKSMRDWEKFAWKKGDVLISVDKRYEIIFDKFVDDTYMSIVGKYCMLDEGYCGTTYIGVKTFRSDYFELQTEDTAKAHYYAIEAKLGGKLNRQTLEIEKAQSFKDGDIVSLEIRYIDSEDVIVETYIVHGNYNNGENLNFYTGYRDNISDGVIYNSFVRPDKTSVRKELLRYATEEEKQQLFSALSKENKAWDAEKKQIVELKPKVLLKPFDKVLVRDFKDQAWQVSLFGYKDANNYYCCNGSCWNQCIPYIGNESLLGTTKNVEG